MISNLYLEEVRNTVRVRKIPWEGYLRAKLLDANHAAVFKALEKESGPERIASVNAAPQGFARAAESLLASTNLEDVTKFVVLFIGDFYDAAPAFAAELVANDAVAVKTLANLLQNKASDQHFALLTLDALTGVYRAQLAPHEALGACVEYICAYPLVSSNVNVHDIAVQALAGLAEPRAYRSVVFEHLKNGLQPILEFIKHPEAEGLNVQYYALVVFWLLSFEANLAQKLVYEPNVLSVLVTAAKSSVKEKIVRVSLAILVNLCQNVPKQAIAVLIAQKALQSFCLLSERKWADEELKADLDQLKTTLEEAQQEMTTFECYLTEITTKQLQWSPPHRNALFWMENVENVKKDHYKVLHMLVDLLASSSKITQAVVCNDIAQIVNVAPDSVHELDKLHAKVKVMGLLGSDDPEVRFEALKTTQAIMGHLFGD